jgi:hypothetical protein
MFASDFSGYAWFFSGLLLFQALIASAWGFAIYRTALALQARFGLRWALLYLPFYTIGWGAFFAGVYYVSGETFLSFFS